MHRWIFNISNVVLLLSTLPCFLQLTTADDGHFTNVWAAEILGGPGVARAVATQHGFTFVRPLRGLPNHYQLERRDTHPRSRRSAEIHTQQISGDNRVVFVEQQENKLRVKKGVTHNYLKFNDPEIDKEWFLKNKQGNANLNVELVWEMGITGTGVVVCFVDDGLEKDHSDLKDNYDPKASYDFIDDDNDPSPSYYQGDSHGTSCAGEVAMMANNSICGVGIAFNAKVGGVRILNLEQAPDYIESQALAFKKNHVDIYSCSWGPYDDGARLEGPGPLLQKTFQNGVKKGRKGLGSIYVWAAGNGGDRGDNCNADGYTSAIETIGVSAATRNGKMAYYTEKCSSTLATTFSGGMSRDNRVVSADINNGCTEDFTGTSAAVPMTSGILALLLQANPNVTWRDIQHIIVHTSRMEPLSANKGWYRNGAGYCVNLESGFGLMDALAIVQLADPKTWRNVGEQHVCKVKHSPASKLPLEFRAHHPVELEFQTDGCTGTENEVNFLEHIQVIVTIDHTIRGHIYVEIESPSGTITPLMLERKNDDSAAGFNMWPLMSTHNWGERPQGTWKLRVADKRSTYLHGTLRKAKLILYGTSEQPEYQKNYSTKCGHLDTFANITTSSDEQYSADIHETYAQMPYWSFR
ncbi:hypothetical protein BsWGS_00151 [Bradybaena similaris]